VSPSRLRDALEGEPAFVPYLVAGDPELDDALTYVEVLVEGGADVVELGLPFSEPIADGATIQDAIVRALDAGMTPARFFEFVERLDVDVPLVCMTYYNLIYRYGDDPGPGPFVRRAADAGIAGLIVPDLPAAESEELYEACREAGLDLVFIVAPTTTDDRLERLMTRTSGYVYVQARLGVTGAREDVDDATRESLARLAGYDVPKAVGFGIKTGEHAREVIAAGADGIVVGSALVDIVAEGIETGRPVEATADRLRERARELKRGAVAGGEDRSRAQETETGTETETGSQRTPGPERT